MGKGWFIVKNLQEGDRTLAEQMTGLAPLCARVAGKSVLDLGCAEGLIGRELVMQHGAARVVGVSIIASEIEVARKLCASLPMTFHVGNLNDMVLDPETFSADVVLMLSVPHKLKRPELLLAEACSLAGELIVIRLPAPVIDDARSGWRRLNVPQHMAELGWRMVLQPEGPRREWTGYFEKGAR